MRKISPVNRLVHTSASDCQISLIDVTDLDVLRQASAECSRLGYKTKVKFITSRIRKLEAEK